MGAWAWTMGARIVLGGDPGSLLACEDEYVLHAGPVFSSLFPFRWMRLAGFMWLMGWEKRGREGR